MYFAFRNINYIFNYKYYNINFYKKYFLKK